MQPDIKPGSVDTPEFSNLLSAYKATGLRGADQRASLIAHINAWSDERCNEAINQLAASRAMLPVTDSVAQARQEALAQAMDACREVCLLQLDPDKMDAAQECFDAIRALGTSVATPVAGWVSVEDEQPAYTVGVNPDKVGVYACRVPVDIAPTLCEDKFLMWLDGRWGYLGSDQNYRGEVVGWIGPLPRRIPAPVVTPTMQEQS